MTIVPTDIAGCVMWLDATQEAFADGATVATWTDRSGNANHATQGTAANRPLFETDGINGLDAITFDGSRWFVCPAIFNTGAGTSYVVAKKRATAYGLLISAADTSGSNNRGRWYIQCDANSYGFAIGGDNYTSSAPAGHGFTDGATTAVLSMRSTGSVFDTSKSCEGSLETTGLSLSRTAATARIGAFVNNTQRFVGEIGEIIHYSSALSDANHAAVLSYLRRKWDLTCGGPTVGLIGSV